MAPYADLMKRVVDGASLDLDDFTFSEASMTPITLLLAQWLEAQKRVAEIQGDLVGCRVKTARELREIREARARAANLLEELLWTATQAPTRRRPNFAWYDRFRFPQDI